jgi:hypothetical protein
MAKKKQNTIDKATREHIRQMERRLKVFRPHVTVPEPQYRIWGLFSLLLSSVMFTTSTFTFFYVALDTRLLEWLKMLLLQVL